MGSGAADEASHHLIHCELSGSGSKLSLRACSTQMLSDASEFLTELTESVANAIVCWAWATSMASTPT